MSQHDENDNTAPPKEGEPLPTSTVEAEEEKTTTPKKLDPKKKRLITIALIAVGIISALSYGFISYLREQTTQFVPPTGEVTGVIVNETDEPIDGALIIAGETVVATAPDGTYALPVPDGTEITVTAHGYQEAYAYAGTTHIALSPEERSGARIIVGDHNEQVLPDALVVRLDPNTSEPIDDAVTNKSGAAVFNDILSGQATFIVLHPDYTAGWVETALPPGKTTQVAVRLTPAADTEPKVSSQTRTPLLPIAHAQDLTDQVPPSIGSAEFDIAYRNDANLWDPNITITQNTRTLIEVTPYKEDLAKYIQKRKALPQTAGGLNLNKEGQEILADIYNETAATAPLKVVRVTQVTSNITYRVDAFWDTSGEVPVKKYAVSQLAGTNWRVAVQEPSNTEEQSLLITKQPAVTINNQTLVADAASITSQARVPWIEATSTNGEGREYTFLRPTQTVCCRRPTDTTTNSPTTVSSNTLPGSDLQATTASGTQTTITAAQQPELNTEVVNTGAAIPDIPAPHPWEAPFGFQESWLQATMPEGSNSVNYYIEHHAQYEEAWQNYLRHRTTVNRAQGGSNNIANDIQQEINQQRQDIQNNYPDIQADIDDANRVLRDDFGIDASSEQESLLGDDFEFEPFKADAQLPGQDPADTFTVPNDESSGNDEESTSNQTDSTTSSGDSGGEIPSSDYSPPGCAGFGVCAR